MFSKIFRFGHRKQAKKVHVSDSDDDSWLENFHLIERGLPNLDKSQVRVLVYKDHDKRGDKFVLFDSKTDIQDETEQQWSGATRPTRKRVSSDAQLLGEMIFGSVEMTYKGPTVKAHSIRNPPQLLLTKVFALNRPRASQHGGSPTSNRSSESLRFSESMSSVSSLASPVTSSDNEESSVVAQSVPVPGNFKSLPRTLQLQNFAEGLSNSMSDTSRSLTFPRTSSANTSTSYQRRWMRNQVTRMEYGCSRRNESFSEEMSMRSRRRPKIGIGVLFTLWEDKNSSEECNRLFQNFVFSHFPLFESHIHRLKRMVEKALLPSVQMSGSSQDALLKIAANTFAENILNLYYAPRIRNPLWLTMLSEPDQCNTICEDLVPQIVNAVELYNTKQTNYFLSTLLTAVLTFHVAWVTTVTPSSDVARRAYLDKHSSETLNVLGESHPYNPLWAQLSELYGACGNPTKMARTVILGQDQQIVTVVLHILSYFIRCSEVFEQPLEQSPSHLTGYLDSLECQSRANELEREDETQVRPKCDTIVENSEEVITEPKRSSQEEILNKYSALISQSSTSYLQVPSEKLPMNSNNGIGCSEVSDCPEENVEISENSQTKLPTEIVDSCGEDSGICSTDFDSSMEVPKNDTNSGNCVRISRNFSNGDLKDSDNCFNDSINCRTKSEQSSKNLLCNGEIPVQDCRNLSGDLKKCLENCRDCTDDSRRTNEEKGSVNSLTCSDERLCEECENVDLRSELSGDISQEINEHLCHCNGVCRGNTKEHKMWTSFLRTSCCNRNARSLDRRCLSAKSFDETLNTKSREARRYSSEKESHTKGSKVCVQKDGKILSLDRQNVLNMFISSYPLCPLCKGQLNFAEHDFKTLTSQSNGCLCQDCEKIKSCRCRVVETDFGENGRCSSSTTLNSEGYSSGISVQSFGAERGSLSSLSTDSGLNEHCLQSDESFTGNFGIEDQACMLELPEARLDEEFTKDDVSCKTSQDCQLFSFGRSLMAGYCNEYVPDFVLHGTDRCTEEQAKQGLHISLEEPVVDSPISESVIITGDTDKWECTIKTLSKQRKSTGNHPSGIRSKKAERSTLVHNFLTSFCDLWELNMPATFCLMHLEDKMKELYLRSKVVSEYLLTQKKYVTMRDLMSTFGYGECDLALIMSIIGVHSPLAVSRIPLP
ncbi:folliculin-interacting protein 2-like [Dendronephthya gigantea]|uniref:folliculin-interacting protein 2-like n=1 Tax=Dendronephthya gigantea TaxID=151771 RepID=UPI00106ADA14|nr:folliculin-interacting protein 2-like [Dendronephthya gigantea]